MRLNALLESIYQWMNENSQVGIRSKLEHDGTNIR